MAPRQAHSLTRAEIRAAVEDAAAALFAAKGYEAATVDEIVAKAEVSKPALYRCFESKKDLYLTLLERHRDEMAAVALAEVDTEADPRTWLPRMLDAWFSYVDSHPFAYCMFRDTSADPDIQSVRVGLQAWQRTVIVTLLREFGRDMDPGELEPLGEVIRSSLYALALWWADHPDTRQRTLVSVMEQVIAGVALAPEAPNAQ
jgi:AcrR family transcriptional regulator